MKTKLLYLLVPLIFSGCLASLSHDKSQELDQAHLNEKLLDAARSGSLDLLTDLVKRGVDVNVRDDEGHTALLYVAKSNHLACVKALIEAKADVNVHDNCGQTALNWAAQCGHLAGVKALIGAKANVNACSYSAFTSLHYAAVEGHFACVNALIEAKADVNARTNYGKTALHYAAGSGHLDCVKALIEAKADVNAEDSNGKTALYCAHQGGHLDCVKTLIKCSYMLLPSEEAVSESRRRIFRFLGVFVGLRKQHFQVAGLQDTTLQHEILSWDRDLQEDLVVILLDELKKWKEIKNVALIRSKEAAVSYLTKKVKEMVPTILDRVGNLVDLIKEGLDERINQLRSKNRVVTNHSLQGISP